jgi:hypothetical protein
MNNNPTDAKIDPRPLISLVTVPRAFEFPDIEGCSEISTATADVIILLGPPTSKPIKAKAVSNNGVAQELERTEKNTRKGIRNPMNTARAIHGHSKSKMYYQHITLT